ncbi:Glycine-rich protein [Spatholobus suberectus]|nr:Glycine-rich protein [Spatholobus suberectus]
MGSKALLVLVMLLASVLLLLIEVASKDVDEKFDKNDGNLDTNGVDDMKYYGGWQHGWGWRRGWGGGYYCPFGCCSWNYYGGCWRCCYYPGEHVDAHTAAEPLN